MAEKEPKWDFYGDWIDASDLSRVMQEYLDFFDDEIKRANSPVDPDDFIPLPFERFQELLYESNLIASVIYLESMLTRFLDKLKEYEELAIAHSQLKGGLYLQFKTYCSLVPDLDIDFENRIWKDVHAIIEMRNCVVHNSRDLAKMGNRRKTIESFIERVDGFSVQDNYLAIEKAGCLACVQIIEKLLLHVNAMAVNRFGGREIQDEDIESQ